jgi:hypothetical protein
LASIRVLSWPEQAQQTAFASCASAAAPLAAYCGELTSAYSQLDAAAQRVAADAGAIEQTISRETAAVKRRNQSAVNEQDAHLGLLLKAMRTDRGAEQVAGGAVAAVLNRAGVLFKLSKRQSAKVIAAALRQASRRGVTRREIKSLAPAALSPRPADLRAGLGRL